MVIDGNGWKLRRSAGQKCVQWQEAAGIAMSAVSHMYIADIVVSKCSIYWEIHGELRAISNWKVL